MSLGRAALGLHDGIHARAGVAKSASAQNLKSLAVSLTENMQGFDFRLIALSHMRQQ